MKPEYLHNMRRGTLAVALITLAICATTAPVAAACQKCDGGGILLPDICWPVDQGEAGKTICVDTFQCQTSGDSCVGDYTGGTDPGGGGGGGGGDTCSGGSFCPAECFTCDPYAP